METASYVYAPVATASYYVHAPVATASYVYYYCTHQRQRRAMCASIRAATGRYASAKMRAMNAESRTTTDMVSMTGYDPARVVSVHCGRCTLTTTDMVSMTGYDPARRVTIIGCS